MSDHTINIVEISDDDEVFMEINLPVDNNLLHMDSDDDELFTNDLVSGVKGLNWRPLPRILYQIFHSELNGLMMKGVMIKMIRNHVFRISLMSKK